MTWRLLLSPPFPGPENMALDQALMARARRTGETVLRVYGWSRPTLSFGRHQRAVGLYRDELLAKRGIETVRRPTGGRALMHHREVTYSVTAPVTTEVSPRVTYRHVNRLLTNALERLGVPVAEAAPSARAPRPSAAACFAEPTTGELLLGTRKLVGSAQWRDEGAMLQHGSILIDDDQALIPELMRTRPPSSVRPATLRDAMGRAPVNREVAEALFDAVRDLADPGASTLEPDARLLQDTESLAVRYRDPAWTWQR